MSHKIIENSIKEHLKVVESAVVVYPQQGIDAYVIRDMEGRSEEKLYLKPSFATLPLGPEAQADLPVLETETA